MPPPSVPALTGPTHTITVEPEMQSLSPDDNSTIDFLLGSFISMDIIASASSRRAPFLDLDHAQVLNNLDISLENFVGCRNSIMALIFEISALDRWKEESEAAHKLSIMALAKRKGQLQERLRRELADIEQNINTPAAAFGPLLWSPFGMLSAGAAGPHPLLNKAFALAAIAYLQVVISGAHPELPEIVEIISDTITVLQSLNKLRLLQSVVWPFCISGCLALEEQQRCFRDLFAAAGMTESTGGTLGEAFKIMQL